MSRSLRKKESTCVSSYLQYIVEFATRKTLPFAIHNVKKTTKEKLCSFTFFLLSSIRRCICLASASFEKLPQQWLPGQLCIHLVLLQASIPPASTSKRAFIKILVADGFFL
jgi:hypothetical protein